jgi:hypothetical protein
VERAGVVFVRWGMEEEGGEGEEEGLRGEGTEGGGGGCGWGLDRGWRGRAGWGSYGVGETDSFLGSRVWVSVAAAVVVVVVVVVGHRGRV